MGAKLSLVRNS